MKRKWEIIIKQDNLDNLNFNDKNMLTELMIDANAGDAAANFILGLIFDSRKDVRAVQFYRKGAEKGLANAQNSLGNCYQQGFGVEQNIHTAIYWYEKAAANGLALAMRNLGMLYDAGRFVTKDDKLSSSWYAKAAGLGDAVSKNNLAYNYAHGLGVPKNMERAVKLWIESARGGCQTAIDWCRNNGVKF